MIEVVFELEVAPRFVHGRVGNRRLVNSPSAVRPSSRGDLSNTSNRAATGP